MTVATLNAVGFVGYMIASCINLFYNRELGGRIGSNAFSVRLTKIATPLFEDNVVYRIPYHA